MARISIMMGRALRVPQLNPKLRTHVRDALVRKGLVNLSFFPFVYLSCSNASMFHTTGLARVRATSARPGLCSVYVLVILGG